MKSKRSILLTSALGIVVALATIGLIPTASAECVCECVYDCSDSTCYCSAEGNSIADCITCLAGACTAVKKATHCPGN